MAKQVQVGDYIYKSNGQAVKVNQITSVQKKGVYCPLTESGSLIVNDFIVSCFANVKHELAQDFFGRPLVMGTKLLGAHTNPQKEGIHPVAKLYKQILPGFYLK